jgi:peptidoglycan/LPS O-acetylase OafA/YrhL
MHKNNFGLLRLSFAFLVIVSHSFELVDGNRLREPLTVLFGTLSFGELGVDGFFLVSGYLIAKSFEQSRTFGSFLWKRILRIYPGFIVAYLCSILIVAPLGAVAMLSEPVKTWIKQPFLMAFLAEPVFGHPFQRLPYPLLNGSMWTISYEFRCYLLVPLLGLIGLLNRRVAVAILAAALLLLAEFPIRPDFPSHQLLVVLIGAFLPTLHFTSIFLVGSCFYLFRDDIALTIPRAALSIVVLLLAMFSKTLSTPAVALLGGYLIFWFAFLPDTPTLNRINTEKADISYGLYLYAWPVQNLLIWYFWPHPLIIIIVTTAVCSILALLSWRLVEEPFLALKNRGRSKVVVAEAPAKS